MATASKQELPSKPSVLFVVTGKRNDDGTFYQPPFMKAQILSLEKYLNKSDVLVATGNNSISGFFDNKARLKILVNEINPDLIHALYGSMTAFIAALFLPKIPLVVSFCGDDILGSTNRGFRWMIRNKLMRYLSIYSAVRAKVVIVKSNNLKKAIPGFLRKKAVLIPNGVNLELFQPIEKTIARVKLGWDIDIPVILFNPSKGTNKSVKNLPLAEQTVEMVREKLPDVQLMLLEDKNQMEIALMMSAADVLILTSFHEGSPNIVKEAMAMNLPVVSVNCGDVKERLEQVTNSYVVDEYNPKMLAKYIVDLIIDGKRSNGRDEVIRQEIDMDRTADKIWEMYVKIKCS